MKTTPTKPRRPACVDCRESSTGRCRRHRAPEDPTIYPPDPAWVFGDGDTMTFGEAITRYGFAEAARLLGRAARARGAR